MVYSEVFPAPIDLIESFVGDRKPLDEYDVPHLAYRIGVGEDHLRAFMEVEARSRGYDRHGRPIMLFEPHVFYRNIENRADRDEAVAQGLAYQRWGQAPYPRDSYPRLVAAMAIDEDAALKACSIGLSQVLVENHAMIGYETPQDMWKAFMDDEENHVEGMVNFIINAGIADDLQHEKWENVARVYNGPGFRKNRYHIKMAEAFAKFRRIADIETDLLDPAAEAQLKVPDTATVRSVQRRLRELGYSYVGKADGLHGRRTRAAMLAFRDDHGLPLIPAYDDQFLSALMLADRIPESESRQSTTVDDVRKSGSQTTERADKSEGASWLTTITGGIAGLWAAVFGGEPPVEDGALAVLDAAKPALDFIGDYAWVVMVGLGLYVIYQQRELKKRRARDEAEGIHAGRV